MYNILVTGVGAIIGYGIIRSLRKSPFPVKIIGIDIYSDAVGQNWCDHFIQGVLASDPKYPHFLLEVIEKYSIDLIIPGIEQDIDTIAQNMNILQNAKAKFVINNPSLLSIAKDKWLTHTTLLNEGFQMIPSFIDGEFSEISRMTGIPMLVKPRRSYASKGIFKINDSHDFYYWKEKLNDNFMVQEIVGDNESEYTVGIFGLGDGSSCQKIMFQRKLSGEGATSKARVFFDAELDSLVDKIVRFFKPMGPTNLQFRYHHGKYLLLEINPRISSSTSLRTAFGYNEAEMCIEFFLNNKIPAFRKIRSGLAVRYIEDLIFYDSDNF